MSLTNYPKVLKYAINDRPYKVRTFHKYENGFIKDADGGANEFKNGRSSGYLQRVKITGWRTEVYDTNGDGTGTAVQENYYTVKDILAYNTETQNETNTYIELYDVREYEIAESNLFTSKNHALSVIKGKYLNSPFKSLADNANLIFSTIGSNQGSSTNNGDWDDWAGMNFKDFNFGTGTEDEIVLGIIWVGTIGEPTAYIGGEVGGTNALIIDNCTFEGATMLTTMNTRAKIRNICFSYDKLTTKDFNGVPLDPALD